MDFQKIIDYLAEDWEKFADRVRKGYEETIDVALDQWDTFKSLDNRIKGAIIGGIVVIILIILGISLRSEPVPIIAKLDTSGILGKNFIALENDSEDIISPVTFVLDDTYIFKLDELSPLQELTIFLDEFHYLVGDFEEGEAVSDGTFVPYTLKVICPLGEKEIELTKKKRGWF